MEQGMRAVGAVPLTADLERMMAAVDADASGYAHTLVAEGRIH
jgi:hypothetical protein